MTSTLHIVPHTHWDREWYLTFQQFRVRLVRMMDQLLDILDHDITYRHFMLDGQTILLDDYLEIRPERAGDIARFARAGRLSIGPWYALPDEFLVAPESLLRNLMLGERDCGRFGDNMRVGYVPDPFGHIAQLPQILSGLGIESAVFRRGLALEPVELWWESPNGSRVLVCYLRDGYDNAARLPTTDDAFVAAIRGARDGLAPHVASGHFLLLAGSDHQEPQAELPALINHANAEGIEGGRLVQSSLPGYVEAVRQVVETRTLETVRGELRSPQRHHLLPDVLSARMWIKQRNDAVETLLTRWTEPLVAWAELLDSAAEGAKQHTHLTGHEPLGRVRNPQALVWQAWRLLLQNHPHDSICGCSVDQVHREMVPRFDQAEQIGEEIVAQSLTTIAAQVDTRQDGMPAGEFGIPQPLIVFNPTSGPRTDVVVARLRLPAAPDALQVLALDGQILPHQVAPNPERQERPFFHVEVTPQELVTYIGMIQGGCIVSHVIHQVEMQRADDQVHVQLVLGQSGEPNHAQIASAQAQIEAFLAAGEVSRFIVRTTFAELDDLVFVAPDLPPHGYATFSVRAAPPGETQAGETRSTPTLENDLFTLQADPTDGTLTLVDKTHGLVYPGLNRFVDGGDRGDEYNYCQPEDDQLVTAPLAPLAIRVLENGPARQMLEIAQVYRLPRALRPDRRGRSEDMVDVPIVSRVSLYPGVRRVDVETTVDNLAQDHRLRAHFPLPVAVDHAHTEAHFYVARRPIPQVDPALDTADWIEQPVPTIPQRGWSDVSVEGMGLMIANRGLPEIEFIPQEGQTTVALTLLRCVGWLSRGDMHCRQGHAGPELPTPEAQCPGRHTFRYALIPHAGDLEAARAQAEAFRAPLRAVAAGVHPGPLPPVASLVRAEPSTFALSAIRQSEGRATPGLIVRGVSLSDQPSTVRLRPWRRLRRAARVSLRGEYIEPLAPDDDGTVTFVARPWEIVTLRLEK
jgi:alpha-mannosidase